MTVTVTVLNDLTLNGTATLTGAGHQDDTQLLFPGAQTLSGTGTVFLSANAGNSGEAFLRPNAGGTLTIDSGILVRGYGFVGWPDRTIVNLGTIQADVAGQNLTVDGLGWSTQGTGAMSALNGGR